MHFAEIGFRNWKCFAGEHHLVLGAKAYAIIASMKTDPDRSNWLGKSSFIEVPPFVLFGVHDCPTEDEWITHGEKVGEGFLVLDNGAKVTRSRILGKSTQLYLNHQGKSLMGDEAQSEILEMIGLSASDFRASVYVEQKRMSQLITMRSSELTDIAREWFNLSQIEQSGAFVRECVTKLVDRESTILATIQAQVDIRKQSLGEFADIEALTKHHQQCIEYRDASKYDLQRANEAQRKAVEVTELRRKSERFDALKIEGETLAASDILSGEEGLDEEELKVLRSQKETLDQQCGVAAKEVETKRLVARGKFDGQCPVGGMSCPITSDINARSENASKEAERAVKLYESLRADRNMASGLLSNVESKAIVAARAKERLEGIKREMQALIPARKEFRKREDETKVDIGGALASASGAVMSAAGAEASASQRIASYTSAEEKISAAQSEQADITRRLTTEREASVIFRAAERQIAEIALADIEEGANGLLRESGIALSLSVRWSHEGKGLASACDTCGHPFPTSTKERACKGCGGPRGAKRIERLDVVLSNRSGAATDLAGVALQFAASSWLREDRKSDFAVVLLDEPFGSLDATHRRAFSAHLSAMLSSSRYGFRQAFVIAHHASVLDALPGRIFIESDGKHSTAKVVT